ncbi:hypothetical protein ASE37_19135 [Rhizobium sp. Root268]|nr:hypothetical protein ASC86_18635 [Rhizobium sp. Root1212]KRD21649.1 hypothetical protein ASE37_19135 [Rhizobium sp. Root268]
MLRYVVTETLEGRSTHIKAYTVAVDVFRRTNFDAQNDPVVRIEAARLRRDLERYYLMAGQNDPVVITIPKGGYVPTFRFAQAVAPQEDDADPPVDKGTSNADMHRRTWGIIAKRPKRILLAGVVVAAVAGYGGFSTLTASETSNVTPVRPTIAVEQFRNSNGDLVNPQAVSDLIISNLVKFKEFKITDQASGSPAGESIYDEARYSLQGSIREEGERVRLATRLVRQSDKAVLWANNYDIHVGTQDILEAETALAGEIATAVAQPFGVMFEGKVKPDGVGGWQAYDCSLSYYSYRRSMTAEALETAQACLKSATKNSPRDATSLALLSLTNLDQVRFAYKFDTKPLPEKLDLASQQAKQAVSIDHMNPRALQAVMLTSFFRNDVTAALEAGAAAYELNPNDTEVAGEYGLRLSMSGKWETGCDLVSKAASKGAGPTGYYEVGMTLCALMRNDLQAAELWSRMSDLDYNPMHRMVLASILGASGKTAQAKTEIDWLNHHAPALMSHLEHEISVRLVRLEDRERVFAGLRAAGVLIGKSPAPATN